MRKIFGGLMATVLLCAGAQAATVNTTLTVNGTGTKSGLNVTADGTVTFTGGLTGSGTLSSSFALTDPNVLAGTVPITITVTTGSTIGTLTGTLSASPSVLLQALEGVPTASGPGTVTIASGAGGFAGTTGSFTVTVSGTGLGPTGSGTGTFTITGPGTLNISILTAPGLNFGGFPSGTILTNQYPGVIFSNTIILTTGITLDELECPPYAGANVASDNGGPMTISFASPLRSISGYFTYSVPLAIQAFGSSNNPIASAVTASSNNQALSGVSGSKTNELVKITPSASIYKIVITGGALGSSFTVGDITPIGKCDANQDGLTNVQDTQLIVNAALGSGPASGDDLKAGGSVSIVDIQISINAALGLGCSAK